MDGTLGLKQSVVASLQQGNPDWTDVTSTSSSKVSKYFSNFVLTPGTLERHADRLGFWERTLSYALETGILQDSSCLWFEAQGLEDKFRIGSLTPRGLDTVLVRYSLPQIAPI